jgi:hypothetical protein
MMQWLVEKGTLFTHIWADVQKWCQNVCYKSVQIHRLWKRHGSKKASFALTANHTWELHHHVIALHALTWDFLQTSICHSEGSCICWHEAWVKSLNRTSVRSISTAHTTLKMQGHKIQVCFTICLIESVSNSYLVWIQMHQFCHISRPWHFLLCKSNQRFSSFPPISCSTSSVQYVFCTISYCLNWNLVLKTFSHNHKLFSHMEVT